MKKFIAAALVASLVTTPVMAAGYERDRGGDHRPTATQMKRDNRAPAVQVKRDNRAPVAQVKHDNRSSVTQYNRNTRPAAWQQQQVQSQKHQWKKGQKFDRRYASNYREIGNPRSYHLNNAPRGYHWVQSGNDAVLVGIATGIISAIVANAL